MKELSKGGEMSYPEYQDLEDPLLCYIYTNGEDQYQVRSSDTYEPLADYLLLTTNERTQTRDEVRHDGRREPLWNNMVQWARRKLKNKGYLASSPHGTWRLSEEGILAAKRVCK
jgi:5-methylcytosine-specific restriction protein A